MDKTNIFRNFPKNVWKTKKMCIFALMMEETTIEKEDLIGLAEKLKSHSNQWATLMASDISLTPEWKEYSNDPLTVDNLRKISEGKIINKKHRRIFMKCGVSLLNKFKEEAEEDKRLIMQAKNSKIKIKK